MLDFKQLGRDPLGAYLNPLFFPMFNRFFRGKSPKRAGGSGLAGPGSEAETLAAELLIDPTALLPLSLEEARVVVAYMQPRKIARGTTFISEGDSHHTDFMMLLLDGQVTVESIVVSREQPMTVTVLESGSLIGELALIDGEPRHASCTAASDLRCAILTRRALEELITDEPAVAAKLLLGISARIAVRMRENFDKLKLYAKLTQAMEQEIAGRTKA